MLDRTRHLRLALVLIAGLSAGLFPILGRFIDSLKTKVAWADDDDDDDSADDDDDKGGGDDDDDDEVDEDQPPITAGGLYTIKTYPQGELQRPLTMTEGITEIRIAPGTDISNKGAFETFGLAADVRYGYKDNVELRGGFKGIDNFKVFGAYAAFEGSIIYDLVDFRAGLEFDHAAGSNKVKIPIGVPFRYAPKPQVAVTAFETLFSIDFDSKPDVTPNVGIVVQPAPIVAIILKASLIIPDFDFSNTDNVVVPATGAIQLTPNNKIDAGMEFTFNNMNVQDPVKFYDSRFLLFFGRFRL